jgi:hypothetical protein
MDSRPSNYLINHVSWSAPDDRINWSELRLVRNPSGHPQNINDGVLIYSALSDAVVLEVESIFGSNSVNQFTFTGGGRYAFGSTDGDYITYTAVAATGGSGNGAKFDVVRSKTDLGSVISVTVNSAGENYAAANTLTIPKESIGYSVSNTDATDITVTISSTAGTQSGIKTVTVVSNPSRTSTTFSNVISACTSSAGKNATFTLTWDGTFLNAPTINNSGAGYKVGDIIRIPSSVIGGQIETVNLGVANTFHIFDDGTDTGKTINPGYGVEGTYINAPRHYYSLFLKYTTLESTFPKWKKLSESESFVIQDRGTLDVIINHLPSFYTRTYNNTLNSDLSDFLSLFAFHLDTYIAANTSVFDMNNVDEVDEKLMRLMLKQFGASLDDVSGVSQGRVLLANVIRNYKYSGTNPGIKDFVESYTGYGANIVTGKNILPDYNSSSFAENVGKWLPDASSNGYLSAAPYTSLLTYVPDVSTGTSTIESYTNYYADVAVDSTGAIVYDTTLTSANSAGTIVTVPSTEKLFVGSRLKVTTTAGTGVLAAGTLITSILSSTTFRINTAPTTTLANASLVFSTNLVSGMARIINASSSGNVSLSLGPERAVTVATAASGTTAITVKPNIASVNDYVFGSDYSAIPEGTQITAIGTTGVITLSTPLIGTLSSASTITFSPPPAADKVAANVAWVPIQPSKPYAFGVYVNAAGGTTKTATSKITWYDINGNVTGTAVTGTLSAASQSTNTNWYQTQISGLAPFNAAYAEPNITLSALSSTAPYFLDAAFFASPSTVNFKVLSVGSTQSTIALTTTEPHNFYAGNSVSVSGLGIPFDGTFTVATSSQDINVGNYEFRYVINSTSYPATTENVIGYAASVPLKFEEARETRVEVSANRVNLCPNPSFEVNTDGWTAGITGTTATTGVSIARYAGSTASITAISFSSGIITYTAANTFLPGQIVTITGASHSPYNITYPIATATSGAFTINAPVPAGTTSTASASAFIPTPVSGNAALQVSLTSTAPAFANAGYTGTSPAILVISGRPYTFSAYVYLQIGATGAFDIYVDFYDRAGTILAHTALDGTDGTDTVVSTTSGWVRVSAAALAPNNAYSAKVYVRRTTNVGATIVYYVDNVLVENSSALNYYFDGSFDGQSYEADRDSMWQDTAHYSPSHLYYNRVSNVGRIDTMMSDVMYYA